MHGNNSSVLGCGLFCLVLSITLFERAIAPYMESYVMSCAENHSKATDFYPRSFRKLFAVCVPIAGHKQNLEVVFCTDFT